MAYENQGNRWFIFLCFAVCALTFFVSETHSQSSMNGTELLSQLEQVDGSQAEPNSEGQAKRIYLVGSICGAILGVLITLFGYFQLNNATRGFYSGRLQTLALATVAVILLLAFWFAQKFAM